jgi:hypothetical protein
MKPLSVESLALLRSLVERHGVASVAAAVESMRPRVYDLERLDVDGIDWVWIQFSDLEPMVRADISARIGGGMAMADRYSGLDGRTYRWG